MASENKVFSYDDLKLVKNASAASFGLDRIAASVQAESALQEAELNKALEDFCYIETEDQASWGGGGMIASTQVDEYGLPLASKASIGLTAGFPIHTYAQQLGFTADAIEDMEVSEMATILLQAREGYFARVIREMKRSIYGVGNGTTAQYSFTNKKGVAYNVYGLANGGVTVGTIPDSPSGTAFANTHTHLLAETVVTAADVQAMVDTVTEHGNTRGLRIYLNAADKAAFVALTGYTALSSALLNYAGVTSTIVKLDEVDVENQMIGYWTGGVEVWVKSWACDGYLLCAATKMPSKVLGMRVPVSPARRGWHIAGQFKDFPLQAEFAKFSVGFGVFDRTMAAVNYMDSDTWTAPTIA